jgi:hypothetical protein
MPHETTLARCVCTLCVDVKVRNERGGDRPNDENEVQDEEGVRGCGCNRVGGSHTGSGSHDDKRVVLKRLSSQMPHCFAVCPMPRTHEQDTDSTHPCTFHTPLQKGRARVVSSLVFPSSRCCRHRHSLASIITCQLLLASSSWLRLLTLSPP